MFGLAKKIIRMGNTKNIKVLKINLGLILITERP